MLFLFLAILFGFIWYAMVKELKSEFNRYLKYGSLFLIVLLVAIDLFMFIETNRYTDMVCCLGGSCKNDSTSSGVGYNYLTQVCPDSLVLNAGNNLSGDVASLCNDDNNSYVVEYNSITGLDLQINSNANNPKYVNIKYKSSGTDNMSIVQFYDGIGWNTFYSYSDTSGYYSIQIPTFMATNTSSYDIIKFSDSGLLTNGQLDIEQLTLTNDVFTPMYSNSGLDTATIVAYHASEYAVMPILVNLIPAFIGFIAFMMFVQYMMSMYSNQISGRNQDLTERTNEKGFGKK